MWKQEDGWREGISRYKEKTNFKTDLFCFFCFKTSEVILTLKKMPLKFTGDAFLEIS